MDNINRYSFKMFEDYINKAPYLRKKDILGTVDAYLKSIENDDIASKENVVNFLMKANSSKSLSARTSRLRKFFDFCVDNKIVSENPVDLIDQNEIEKIKEKIDANIEYVSYEKLRDIVDDKYKDGKIVEAIIINAVFEGISFEEIANLKKEDVLADAIIIRDGLHLKVDDNLLKMLNEFIKMDKVVLNGNGSTFDFVYLPLVESKYVIRYTARGKKAEDDAERTTQAYYRFYHAKIGIGYRRLMESGFLHHVKEMGLELEDVTKSKINDVLNQYNLSWRKGYDILRKGL